MSETVKVMVRARPINQREINEGKAFNYSMLTNRFENLHRK